MLGNIVCFMLYWNVGLCVMNSVCMCRLVLL